MSKLKRHPSISVYVVWIRGPNSPGTDEVKRHHPCQNKKFEKRILQYENEF